MAVNTDHTHIELSPDIQLFRFDDAVTEYKGELTLWSHLPDEDDRDDEPKHVVLSIGAAWGKEARFLSLSPEQARALAHALNKHADEVEAYEMEDA